MKKSPTIKNKNGQVKDLTPTKQKKRRQKNVITTAKSSTQALQYRVPECVEHFVHAIVDPFRTPAGACLPCDLFPLPSSKVKTYVRGRFQLGTSGIGFAAANIGFANDAPVVQYTTAATALSTFQSFSLATNTQTLLMSMLPYSTAQLAALSVSARAVAGGIRAKYVGSLMNRNGTVTAYEDPDHQDATGKSLDTLNSNPYTTLERVGGDEWDHEVCWSGPIAPIELEFVNEPYASTTFVKPLILGVSGTAGDIYELEFYQHIEYVGSIVPNKSKSHAEAQLFGKAMEVVKDKAANAPIRPDDGPSIWESFKSVVAENLPQIVQVGVGIARGILMEDPMGGGAMVMSGLSGMHQPKTIAEPKRDQPLLLEWHK